MIDLPAFDALALSLHHSPGTHAIVVGSGLSSAAGIPTGWVITLNLISRLGALEGVTESVDWEKWYRAQYNKEPSYSEILDTLASTQSERRAVLDSFIATGDDGEPRKPTKAHHALASLVASGAVRVVITTNFDRLIEAALRDVGVEPTVIASDDAIAGATPLVHAKCTVIKVHGDYLDARIKNTDAELADYSPAMNALLDQVFDNFGLLAVGWSGEWDKALRSAIQRAPSRRYPFYWASCGPVGSLAQDLIDQRGGRIFSITDADSFFVKLGETLEALKQASRPHPLSIEMAIALARRYCRDDKFAMEWSKFLHDEVEKVRSFFTGPEYPTWNRPDETFAETLNHIVSAFLSKTEILRRVGMICGNWGTGDATRSFIKAIQDLSSELGVREGVAAFLSLRKFGASTCFYWCLAGLIARDHWNLVSELLHAEITVERKSKQLCHALPFTLYRLDDWNFLSTRSATCFPVSEFLFEVFDREAPAILFTNIRTDELFDYVEMYILFEFAVHQVQREASSFSMPSGRFIGKDEGDFIYRALNQAEQRPDDHPIFRAGLQGGNSTEAKKMVTAVRDFCKRNPRWI